MPARPKDLSAGYFIQSGSLKPPDGLPRAAASLWRRIMATTPRDQWRPGDLPLLQMFCRTALLADEAIRHLEEDGQLDAAGKVSPWVKVASDHGKTLALLASKLRLSPSSRVRPEAHSLQQRPAHSKPWQWGDTDRDSLLAR